MNPENILVKRKMSIKDVMERIGLSRAGLYLRTMKGTFPRPIKPFPKEAFWFVSEIDMMVQAYNSGADRYLIEKAIEEIYSKREKASQEFGNNLLDSSAL